MRLSIGPNYEGSLRSLTVNKRHARAILATFADTLQITIKEVRSADLEAFLDHLRRVLVHAVLCGEPKNVVDGATAIGRRSMFTDVLDAPIAELAMGYDINTGEDLVDAGTLSLISGRLENLNGEESPYPPLNSSRRCSAQPSYQSRPTPPHATCPEEPR